MFVSELVLEKNGRGCVDKSEAMVAPGLNVQLYSRCYLCNSTTDDWGPRFLLRRVKILTTVIPLSNQGDKARVNGADLE